MITATSLPRRWKKKWGVFLIDRRDPKHEDKCYPGALKMENNVRYIQL